MYVFVYCNVHWLELVFADLCVVMCAAVCIGVYCVLKYILYNSTTHL